MNYTAPKIVLSQMWFFKCVFSTVLWTVLAVVAYFILSLVIGGLLGLFFWDFDKGLGVVAPIVVFIIPLGILYGFAKPIFVEAQRRSEISNSKREATRRLTLVNEQSQQRFELLHNIVERAEYMLIQAKRDFDETAYVPFWENVERAARELAAYHDQMEMIQGNAASYTKEKNERALAIPDFQINVNSFPDPRRSAAALNGLVRLAQRDFQFASIYEQRRTNQILIEGFGSLTNAINSMEGRLSARIDSLSQTLGSRLNVLAASSVLQNAQIAALHADLADRRSVR